MIKAIVTDIEGTTSSLSFVRDVLFPYARRRIQQFVKEHCTQSEVAGVLRDIRRDVGGSLDIDEVGKELVRWIDEDRKVSSLKILQGLIWEEGYRNGDFYGHIYEDAIRKLREWNSQGIQLYVYSSGSVYAQKLLFSHTQSGDISGIFKGYFDTKIGNKRDTASYATILRELNLSPSEILFLSDAKEELDAARDAGMRTCWLVRDSTPNRDAEHTQVSSFDEILLH